MKIKKDLFVYQVQKNKMIGLIFGESNFPKEILKKIKRKKLKYLIIDLSKKKIFKKNRYSHDVSIGQFGKIIKILNEKKCKKVLFAGKIDKPKISKMRLDLKGVYYIPRIIKAAKLGDAAILKELIKILNENKIKVIKSNFFNPELTLSKGNYTKLKVNKLNQENIRIGLNDLNMMNSYNHVQGLVVRNKKVIIRETEKGTKRMLLLVKRRKKHSGILIKFPKKKQDKRADLPTIGLETLKDCSKAGINGIVLKSNQNIFLDKRKSINYANKKKIFIKII